MTINTNDLKFVIFGAGHDYTLADSGKGEKMFFSHPYVPLNAVNYAGQYYFTAPVYDDTDETVEPIITDVVKDDIAHCTFTPALNTAFTTEGEVEVKVHYRREYAYAEKTILVEKELTQTITVVNHGTVSSVYNYNDVYSDGYCYIHPWGQNVRNNVNLDIQGLYTKVSSIPWRVARFNGSLSGTVTDVKEFEFADFSNVYTINALFKNCLRLTDLTGLEYLDLSSCMWADELFSGCYALNDISALKNWDVSRITDTKKMFKDCYALTDLTPLADWDVSNVSNMSEMFHLTSAYGKIGKLKTLKGLEKWDVSNVNYFDKMFFQRYWLNDISALKNWDMSNALQVAYMFYTVSCRDLTPISNWKFNKVKPTYSEDNTYTGFVSMFSYPVLWHSNEVNKDLERVGFDSVEYNFDYDGNQYRDDEVGGIPDEYYPIERSAAFARTWPMPWDDPDNTDWDSHNHEAEVFANDNVDVAPAKYWINKPSWNISG